ncbi:cytochrome P450 [Plenodomus tracheiphilus IPT5]|uniref:Cytochrome P450 n=1 Tax=Plenodomus tracheiphilus IPT5 TaxID=1408161 RepID=A0A6A7AWK6_9PLEO|nr:cytochrome P450 [Plenodomus tracheiphilus IPT5]
MFLAAKGTQGRRGGNQNSPKHRGSSGEVFKFVLSYAPYNTYLHPLHSFPGPLLWRSFRFPYVISTQRGILHKQLKEFHTKYGPVPSVEDIYANRPGHLPFERNPTWFKKMKPDEPNSIMGFVEEDHTRYTRAFANAFSERSLKEQMPVVESYVDLFISQLKSPVSGRKWKENTIDFTKWFNFLTFDISGNFTYGESFDCVKNERRFTDGEWGINLLIIAFAASETTASTLTAITRELVQHKGALHRLTHEIREAFTTESDITVMSTANLDYLNAVINEGMRLDPAVVIGVPRVVPEGGDTVCGKWLPGGTYVTFNQFSAYRQAYNFRNPNSFIPERFLDKGKDAGDDMSAFQPFQLGRHTCIGLKVAYSEMRVVLARLLCSFDLQLADENDRWDWGKQNTYILWVGVQDVPSVRSR